jgi:hypothetical protein
MLWDQAGLGGWQPWVTIGANRFPVPGVIGGVSTAQGTVSLFTGGIDGRVWSTFRDPFNPGPTGPGGWRPWFNLGQNDFPSPLSVAATSAQTRGVSLFTLGYDEKVWSAFFDPNLGWRLWFDLGPNRFPRPGAVSVVSTRPGGVSLFILGFDGRVWSKFFDPQNLGPAELGGWSPWFPVATPNTFPTPSAVTAMSSRPGGTSLFVVGTDGKVWSAFFNSANLGPANLGGWQGWFPIGTKTFPTTDEIRCVRLHVKVLTTPNVPITTMINGMDLVYQTGGMRVAHMTNEFLNLPLLNTLDAGACLGTPTAEQTALFGNTNFIGPEDVVAYFVQSAIMTGGGTLNGCAISPANRPGAAIAQIASPWTLAHEFGHVLGLTHVDDPAPPAAGAPPAQLDRLLTGRGTGSITNPPPDLTAPEIATMRAHPRAVPGSRQ